MMRPEIWELTHRLWGIEISIYDMFILLLNIFMIILAIFCYLIACYRNKENVKGSFKTNGFVNIWDSGSTKAYKIGLQTSSVKKKNAIKSPSKPNTKEEISCGVCGISLSISSQFR
ncbi:unnamed protein product [Blepharisma stoltei]|uniref:ATP synthase F0 subunit 8 n=1 Tax=Blepharisma stoltei TaxID=1481888 RepID=A0AAU9J809_9CILI|nr:unnamed protein product [Blepharisma stoltei]